MIKSKDKIAFLSKNMYNESGRERKIFVKRILITASGTEHL